MRNSPDSVLVHILGSHLDAFPTVNDAIHHLGTDQKQYLVLCCCAGSLKCIRYEI